MQITTVFRSYLSNRQHCTKIGETKSSYMSVSCDVPQGYVRGPLLFLTYIKYITEASSFNNNNNNDILLRTHGPYHRHKNTKSG